MFEYTAIKAMWGVDLHALKDTYIQTKLLTNGLTLRKGYNSLAGIVYREYGIALDKGAQTTFDGGILTFDQFIYSVLDVLFLRRLHNIYEKDMKEWKMNYLYSLECSAIKPIGDMYVNGILFDMNYHIKNTVKEFTTIYNEQKAKLIQIIKDDEKIVEYLKNLKFIQAEDEYLFKWTSPKIKKQVLKLVGPQLDTSNKVIIKKFMKDSDDLDIRQATFLYKFLDGNYEELETFLISNYHKELVELELFIPKDSFLLNFDSPDQRLKLFRYWYPDLKDTNAKTLTRLTKGVLPAYKKYIKAAKMLSSFGMKMQEHIEEDGRIHPSFNQLVSTGRLSSSKPNGQNQPSTSKYRNAYYAQEGWSFVGADYSSQEILVATQASGEEGFWHAIKHGYDLHSYSAYQIYGQKWLDAGGEEKPIGKPKTAEAKALRNASKSLSFSLFYGSSALSLAENLNISHKEAQALMDKYYETFPKLATYFKKQNSFGIQKKYSRGLPPFNRVRFYDDPRNQGERASIGRKSQNAGIQGTSADITKLALVYIKEFIVKKNLQNKVRITLQVHDEIICEVHDSIVKKWAEIQSKLMEKAANVIIPGGWLKAEAEIMKRWNK
jgi:DNA polymerase I-like protein with 3'-5' exonuclease and polymerase domains